MAIDSRFGLAHGLQLLRLKHACICMLKQKPDIQLELAEEFAEKSMAL